MRCRNSFILLLLLVPSLAIALGTNTPVLPATNQYPWIPNVTVGVYGGMALGRTIYTNLPLCNSVAINAAIQNCPSNQVVTLTNQIYDLHGQGQIIGKSGVTIRGQGDSTLILSNFVQVVGNNGIGAKTNIHDGYTQFSTNINVLPGPGYSLAAGDFIHISQDDELYNWFLGDLTTNTHFGQIVRVVSVSNSTNIIFWPPLCWPLTASLSPKYRKFTGTFIEQCGVESMQIRPAAASYGVFISAGNNNWVSNVTVTNIAYSGVYTYRSLNTEIRRLRVNRSISGGDGYGMLTDSDAEQVGASSLWTEDSIFDGLFHSIYHAGAVTASAASYNFSTNEYTQSGATAQTAAFNGCHYMGTAMVLWEGNYGNHFTADVIHGSANLQILWRNRLHGISPTPPQPTERGAMVNAQTNGLYYAAVGNVLGDTWSFSGGNNFYEPTAAQWAAAGAPYGSIWLLGITFYTSPAGLDTRVKSTMTRYQNYDWFNRYVTNETSVAGSPNVEPSLLYLSKPGFFNSLSFPAVDFNSGSNAAPTIIPAGYRYLNAGADPPSGVNTPRGPKIRGIRLR